MAAASGVEAFPGLGFKRALVAVEGNHAADLIREALARAGCRAEICPDLDALLEDGRTEGHALLVLETKDGRWDVVRSLRALGRRIPVLFLSGRFTPVLRERNLGVLECLESPFTMDSFRRAVVRVSRNEPSTTDDGATQDASRPGTPASVPRSLPHDQSDPLSRSN